MGDCQGLSVQCCPSLFFTLALSLKFLIKPSLLSYQKFLTRRRCLILDLLVYAKCFTKLFQKSLSIDWSLLWIALSHHTKMHSSRVGIYLITSSWHMKLLMWLGKRRGGEIVFGVLKIDMSKAYDRVNWSFLKVVLTVINFDSKWIKWIMECVCV